jgi:hypothetical protein
VARSGAKRKATAALTAPSTEQPATTATTASHQAKRKGTTSSEEKYITELTPVERASLQAKKIVAIDPNMRDLLYCVDGPGIDQKKFRHTQSAVRFATRRKQYRKIRDQLRKQTVGGLSVMEWEQQLQGKGRTSLSFDKYREWLKIKNTVSAYVAPVYKQPLFRKLRLGSYIRTQKVEATMIKNFKLTFGSPEKAFICLGDWNEHGRHMKYHEPVKGVGLRAVLRRAGYQLFLVDEYRTSRR